MIAAPAALAMNDETCSAFSRIGQPLAPHVLHRFIVGRDAAPEPLDADAAATLDDPLARLLFARGAFPRTGEELLEAVRAVSDPSGFESNIYLVGEGGQIPFTEATRSLQRGLRFVVALRLDNAFDVIFSVPRPASRLVEAMAWDATAGGFNFYRTAAGGWVFAGNSRDALVEPTAGKGVWESHVSGNLLFKEVHQPWVHWHSKLAAIDASAFEPADAERSRQWLAELEVAEHFEQSVATPTIKRWTAARFSARSEPAGRVVARILSTSTVSLAASTLPSRDLAAGGAPLALPFSFFVDSDALDLLGLEPPPRIRLTADRYLQALATFDVALRSGDFEQPGDTHFAFVVPVRALEDLVALKAAIDTRLLSGRLAATLLMVDFPNPVFSLRRASLARYVPDANDEEIGSGTVAAILAAAQSGPDDSPEREFADLWSVEGDSTALAANLDARLHAYYEATMARAATQEGVDDLVRLAESRRARVRAMPIFTNALMFPATNLPPAALAMRADATVGPP